jgi:hypothetical protein
MKGGLSAEARDALRSFLRASVSWKDDAPFARQSYEGVVSHCEYCEIEYQRENSLESCRFICRIASILSPWHNYG